MKLIIGLGNPGKKYQPSRHNLGFMVLDGLFDFSPEKKFSSLIARPDLQTIAALPQTFMNESGRAVAALVNFYKFNPADLWIIHDDIDLPLGQIRLQRNRSSAGHKGVQSIIEALGTQDFYRLRLGILSENKGKIPTDDFVIQPFASSEKEAVRDMIDKTRQLIITALEKGIKKAMISRE